MCKECKLSGERKGNYLLTLPPGSVMEPFIYLHNNLYPMPAKNSDLMDYLSTGLSFVFPGLYTGYSQYDRRVAGMDEVC
jgi:hypothetical protein